MRAVLRRPAVILALCAMAGCTYLPGSGPTTAAIRNEPAAEIGFSRTDAFALVRVNATIAAQLRTAPGVRRAASLPDTEPPAFRIEEGDTVQVSLVNLSTDGFLDFTQSAISPISLTPLPPQLVGNDGRINVPALGRVRAAGFTPERLERSLTEQLSQVLVDPSVVVQVTDRQSARATIVGAVEAPGSKPILRRDLRLVDLIGLAGGHSAPQEDLVVTFVRDGRETRMPLPQALTDPSTNIRIHPGDVVSIDRSRRAYVIRGAVAAPGRYDFIEPKVTLEEAIARARGILSRRATRSGVFVYRAVPKVRLASLGLDPAPFEGEIVPTVFQFDYRIPTTIFAAQSFTVEEGDVIFVSDHVIEEISKIFGIFTGVIPVQAFVPTPVD